MLPPHCGTVYATFEALEHDAQEHARKNGYALTKKRSKKDKKNINLIKVVLICDRGPGGKHHAWGPGGGYCDRGPNH